MDEHRKKRIKKSGSSLFSKNHHIPGCSLLSAFFYILFAIPAMTCNVFAEEGFDQVAGTCAMGSTDNNPASYGMTPITGVFLFIVAGEIVNHLIKRICR